MLVRACLSGNAAAYQVLVGRYTRPLFNAAYRITASADLAAEATQAAFVKAWENLDRFDFRHRFFSWLYRIALNEALDLAGRGRREAALPENGLPSGDDPERDCAAAESRDHLHRALAELEPPERALVALRHLQGLSYTELSEVFGIPERTIKSRLFSARKKLRRILLDRGWAP